MRPVSEWDEAYIKQLPRGEFDWLEFKGRRGLDFSVPGIQESKVLDQLSVQVSAMANSGGGTIVFGMNDPTDLSEREVDDGGVSLSLKSRNTKEWLEDVIPNLVEFPLRRFSVYALTSDSGAAGVMKDRGLILIEIPDSSDAPHQARDGKYYVRVGGKSRPAGHRIVTDMFNRGTHAEFTVKLSIYSKTWIPRDPMERMSSFMGRESKAQRSVSLVVTVTNIGSVFAQFVRIFVSIPERFTSHDYKDEAQAMIANGTKHYKFVETNQERDVVGHDGFHPRLGSSWFDPILPGLSRSWEFPLNSGLAPEHVKNEIGYWSIHADNAPAAHGEFKFSSLAFDVRNSHKAT